MRLFQTLFAIAGLAAGGQNIPSDAEIQNAIDTGSTTKPQTLWKNIKSNRGVVINRITIVDQVGKQAVFMSDLDLIASAASDAARRHSVLRVGEVKQWSNLGATHVVLIARVETRNALGILEWQAPAVHMIITADGNEIQPLSESPSESSETRNLFVANAESQTVFDFHIPSGPKSLRVTVISSSGRERHKDFDASKLK